MRPFLYVVATLGLLSGVAFPVQATPDTLPQPSSSADLEVDLLDLDLEEAPASPAGELPIPSDSDQLGQEAIALSISNSPPLLITQSSPRPQQPLPSPPRPQQPPPSLQPLPEELPPPPLPPPQDLLTPDGEGAPETTDEIPTTEERPGEIPDTITVQGFEVLGSTVFSDAELQAVTAPFTNRPITFAELLQARSAITKLYVDAGYITSGAYIPPQTLEDGIVQIQVVEGSLADINITGNERLRADYVRSRVAIAASPPLNVNNLLEGLQLLQLNPLIETISAELSAGVRPGTSILDITIQEADTLGVAVSLDNSRSPSIGTFQQEIELSQANLLGFGDRISLTYAHTEGSNEVDGSYLIPVNPRNGTLGLNMGFNDGNVIEPPFDQLDLTATSSYYELAFRQPLYQSPSDEFALGVVLSHQRSRTLFGILDGEAIPLVGTDDEGRTRVTAIRFYQDWVQQGTTQVLAARSQFSVGIDALNATVLDTEPDALFVAWRGQGQWVKLLAPDTLLLVRADVQLSPDPLVSLEQFGLGGQLSVRGYRQDYLLTDSGVFASAEVRLPVLRVPSIDGLLQVAPFVDFGTGWNAQKPQPLDQTLASIGLGLLWQQSDYLTTRLDFGLPLISVEDRDRTWQENGIYFSVVFSHLF